MSYCTIVVALAAAPVQTVADGKEVLEAFAATTTAEPVNILLRIKSGTNPAKVFAAKDKGELIITSGDLVLSPEGDTAILYGRVVCDAQPDQFINEVLVVGRLSSEARVSSTAKSASRSIAVNRFVQGNELTDWFTVRGYGYTMDKIVDAPKGALVSVCGTLEQRTSKKGDPYVEVKCRALRVHSKSKSGGGGGDIAAGTKAAGYSHEDFAGEPTMPHDW